VNKSGRIRSKLLNHLLALLCNVRDRLVILSKFESELVCSPSIGKQDSPQRIVHLRWRSVPKQIQALRERLHSAPILASIPIDRVFESIVAVRVTSVFPLEQSTKADVCQNKTVCREKCSTGEAQ
jgi:hypothetical protein